MRLERRGLARILDRGTWKHWASGLLGALPRQHWQRRGVLEERRSPRRARAKRGHTAAVAWHRCAEVARVVKGHGTCRPPAIKDNRTASRDCLFGGLLVHRVEVLNGVHKPTINLLNTIADGPSVLQGTHVSDLVDRQVVRQYDTKLTPLKELRNDDADRRAWSLGENGVPR